MSKRVTGTCTVCGTKFSAKNEDDLRAEIIRHRITNDPPCEEKE